MKHTMKTKALLNQIESTRQAMEHVRREGDTDRLTGLLLAINALYTQLYQLTKENEEDRAKRVRETDFVLLVSNQHPNGTILTHAEYIQSVRSMSKFDRATHTVALIDSDMVGTVDTELKQQAKKPA